MTKRKNLNQQLQVLFGTAVICMVASLFVAVIQLSLNRWFGSSDLVGFTLWTLPYALIVASMTWLTPRLHIYNKWLIQLVIALLLSGFTSLIWSTTLALLIGASIRTLSLSGFYIWVIGGMAGFLYAFRATKTALDEDVPNPQITWRTILLLIVLPFGCIIGMFLIVFTASEFITYLTEEPQMYLIPQGYTGPVLIVYDRADGQPPKYEDKTRVYEIPANGVLLTQFSWPGTVGNEFWYVDEQGQRTEKIVWDQNCRGNDLPGDPVIACVTGVLIGPNGKNFPRHTGLLVGPESQQAQLAEGSFEWKIGILESLIP